MVLRRNFTKTNLLPAGLSKQDHHCSVDGVIVRRSRHSHRTSLFRLLLFHYYFCPKAVWHSSQITKLIKCFLKKRKLQLKKVELWDIMNYFLCHGVMVTKTWRDHLGSTSVSFPMWLWLIGLTLAHKPPLFMTGILSRPTVELRPTESTPEFSFKFKGAAHFHAVGVSTCVLLLTHADRFKRCSVPSSSHRTTRNRPNHSIPSWVNHKPISTFSQKKPHGAEPSETQKPLR